MKLQKTQQNVKQDLKTKILLALIIATVAFIWIHSMMPAEVSSDESGWVMALIQPILEIFVGRGNVTMHLVRKLAHFTEYFVLGAELALFFAWLKSPWFNAVAPQESRADADSNIAEKPVAPRDRRWLRIVLPLAIGLIVASIDETIQIFADNRGPAIADVLLDFCGVIAGTIITKFIYWLCTRKM